MLRRREIGSSWPKWARQSFPLQPDWILRNSSKRPASSTKFEVWSKRYLVPISRNMLVYRYLLPYQREVVNHVDFAQTNQAATHAWMELGEALLAPLKA